MSKKKNPCQRQCQYCGRLKPDTADHVIPKNMYLNKAQCKDKVFACRPCNCNQKSITDAVVKFLSMTSPLSTAHASLKADVLKHLKGTKKLSNIDFTNPRLENVFCRSGLWVGEHIAFDMPKTLVDGCFWIVRGLVARSRANTFVGVTQCRQITSTQYEYLATFITNNQLGKFGRKPCMDGDIAVLEVESYVSHQCPRTGVHKLRFFGDQEVYVATIPDNCFGLTYSY